MKLLYIDDNKNIIYSRTAIILDIKAGKFGKNENNLTLQEFFEKITKKFRIVEDNEENFDKENKRQSSKIAKINSSNPTN